MHLLHVPLYYDQSHLLPALCFHYPKHLKATPKIDQNSIMFAKKNCIQNRPKTIFAVTAAAAPCCHRRSFLIIAVAFGSSWVKKGDGGLGLRWWWLRV